MTDETHGSGAASSTVVPLSREAGAARTGKTADDTSAPETLSPEALSPPASPAGGRGKTRPKSSGPEADWATGGVVPEQAPRSLLGVIVGTILTIGWFGGLAAYTWYGGWLGLVGSLMPLELVALVTAALLPPTIIWMVVLLLDRSNALRQEAKALRRQLALLAYPAEGAQDRIGTIAESLRAQSRDLSGATREAANHAENLRQILSRETRELSRLNTALAGETAQALERAESKVRNLHDMTTRLTESAREIDRLLTRTREGLDGTAAEALSSAKALDEVGSKQVEGLDRVSKLLQERTAALSILVGRQESALVQTSQISEAFITAAENLSEKAAGATSTLLHQTENLLEAESALAQRTTEAVHSSRTALETINSLVEGLDRSGKILEDRTQALGKATEASGGQIDAASATVLGNLNAFREAATETREWVGHASASVRDAAKQSEDIHRLLQTQAKGLEQAVRTLGEEVRTGGVVLEEQSGAINQAAERATQRIRHLADLLSRNAVDITRTTARSAVEIEQVSEGIKTGNETLRSALSALRIETERTQEILGSATAALSERVISLNSDAGHIAEAANATVEAIASLGSSLRDETRSLTTAGETALGQVAQFQDVLANASRDFDSTVARSVERVSTAGERLRLSAEVLEATATHAIENVSDVGETLESRLRDISRTAEQARSSVDGIVRSLDGNAGLLGEAARRVTEHVRRAGIEMTNHAEALVGAAKVAEDSAKRLEIARDYTDTQRFLTETSYVIERLQATAVDITRLFTPTIEEELWKRFYKGEQNAFLRHAAKTITRPQISAVRKLYGESSEFRSYVTRYMGEYEGLLKAIQINDRADVLHAIFSNSDMGRLYVVLARATGRMEA